MNKHIIKNVRDSLLNQDVSTKNYVDTNGLSTAGGVLSGDIKLIVGSDLIRSLGCNDLTAGKKVTLLLGQTQICYRIPFPIQDYHSACQDKNRWRFLPS